MTGQHRLYVENYLENSQHPVGRVIFAQILDQKNIAIHQTRKDQCNICTDYNVGSAQQNEYEEHLIKKKARLAKKEAKASSANETKVVFTTDLQSVLVCPKLQASLAYYKRKWQVHNFTIFRLNDNDVLQFFWYKSCGGVGANEFSSYIANYIYKVPSTVTHIVLILD